MNPRVEIQAIFRLLMGNRVVTPISYCGDCLVVDWGDSRFRTFTENGRGFNHAHATFARALERSLLDGFLVSSGLVVVPIEILGLLLPRVKARPAELTLQIRAQRPQRRVEAS
jgi:hypothetical protein